MKVVPENHKKQAVDDGDVQIGQLDTLVQRYDRGVIPLGDLAQKDVGQAGPGRCI